MQNVSATKSAQQFSSIYKKIEKKDYIKRNSKLSRGIELLLEDKVFILRSVLGEVAAGNPLTIYHDVIEYVKNNLG